MEGSALVHILDAFDAFLIPFNTLSRKGKRVVLPININNCDYLDLAFQLLDLLVYILGD